MSVSLPQSFKPLGKITPPGAFFSSEPTRKDLFATLQAFSRFGDDRFRSVEQLQDKRIRFCIRGESGEDVRIDIQKTGSGNTREYHYELQVSGQPKVFSSEVMLQNFLMAPTFENLGRLIHDIDVATTPLQANAPVADAMGARAHAADVELARFQAAFLGGVHDNAAVRGPLLFYSSGRGSVGLSDGNDVVQENRQQSGGGGLEEGSGMFTPREDL